MLQRTHSPPRDGLPSQPWWLGLIPWDSCCIYGVPDLPHCHCLGASGWVLGPCHPLTKLRRDWPLDSSANAQTNPLLTQTLPL